MRRAPNCPVTLMLASVFCGLAVSSAAIADQATPAAAPTTVTPATPASQAPVAPATSGAQAATTATAVGGPGNAPAAEPAQQAADAKVTCRTVKTTGSRLQTRKVCSTPDSQKGSADWVREQQARGGIGASAIVNGQ
jgi:hypothetical protein